MLYIYVYYYLSKVEVHKRAQLPLIDFEVQRYLKNRITL